MDNRIILASLIIGILILNCWPKNKYKTVEGMKNPDNLVNPPTYAELDLGTPENERIFHVMDGVDITGGKARNQRDSRALRYYGKTKSAEVCQDLCAARKDCMGYGWHHPNYPNQTFAQQCFGVRPGITSNTVYVSSNNGDTYINEPKMTSGIRKNYGDYMTKTMRSPTNNAIQARLPMY